MKLVSVSTILILASCARDPAPAPAAPRATASIPDLQLPMKQVDGLPITEIVDPGATNKRPVRQALAVLHPTQGNQASGVVRFTETPGRGIEVFAAVHGLEGGPHAFHVHVYGDCSAPDATSAGPHFHFTGSSLDKEVEVITGNLGELRQHRTDDVSSHQARIPNASLQGEFSIIGRAVVVHAQGNDPTVTPDGGAGARLACGVIGVAEPGAPSAVTRR